MSLELALDCRHYLGDRPCRFKARCHCEHYAPMGFRVLVIKLGALGDVIRTACLLPSLKAAWPVSHVTWISKANGVQILNGHPMIDRLLAFDAEGTLAATQQDFDLVLSLDKEAGPAALCNAARSPDKRGMDLSPWGTAKPTGAQVEPYFELGLDDELKFRHNRKSYPQLIHEAVGIANVGERYRLACPESARSRAGDIFDPWRAANPRAVVGLQTGAGTVFANKSLSPPRWAELARKLQAAGYAVVLLGGPEEAEHNVWIRSQVGPQLHDAGCRNTEPEFVGLVDQCDLVVTGDTLALHVALARGVAVVALFGPTCEQEIDLFGLGVKVVSPARCGPCYRRQCDVQPSCMELITDDAILAAVETAARCPRTEDNL